MTDEETTEVAGEIDKMWPKMDEGECADLLKRMRRFGKIAVLDVLNRHKESSRFTPKPSDVLKHLRRKQPKAESAGKAEPKDWEEWARGEYKLIDNPLADLVEHHLRSVCSAVAGTMFPPNEIPVTVGFARLQPITEGEATAARSQLVRHARDTCAQLMAAKNYREDETRDWLDSVCEAYGFTARLLATPGWMLRGIPPKPQSRGNWSQQKAMEMLAEIDKRQLDRNAKAGATPT